MTSATFRGMASATPVTHDKKLDVSKGAISLFEEFLDKIPP